MSKNSIVDIIYFWSRHSPTSMSLGSDISSFQFPIKKICVDTQQVRKMIKGKISAVPALFLVFGNKKTKSIEGANSIIDWLGSNIPYNAPQMPRTLNAPFQGIPEFNKGLKFRGSLTDKTDKKSPKSKKKVSFGERPEGEHNPKNSGKSKSKKSSLKKTKKRDPEVEFIDSPEKMIGGPDTIEFVSEDSTPSYYGPPQKAPQKEDPRKSQMNSIHLIAKQMAEQRENSLGYNDDELPKYY